MNVTRRFVQGGLLAVGLLSLNGCVQSVYPWYEERDVVFDPALAGTWLVDADDGKDCVVTITAGPNRKVRQYNVDIATASCPDADSNISGGAQLLQVGSSRYLNVWDDTYYLNSLMKIRRDGDGFALIAMDPESLELLMTKSKPRLRARLQAHAIVPDDVLVTSETTDLRRFLRENAGKESLFNTENEFRIRRR